MKGKSMMSESKAGAEEMSKVEAFKVVYGYLFKEVSPGPILSALETAVKEISALESTVSRLTPSADREGRG